MSTPILATKLYMPPLRPKIVSRPHLIERLNEGLHHKLSLISAPAGFGKTTLISEWIASSERPIAWLSLDEGDNDPTSFLTYLVAALQTIVPKIGEGILSVLQAPQPPPAESILTALLNEIASLSEHFVLVLDDYHAIDSRPIDHALSFLIENLPPQMHLVIATREDPHLPLARLRARSQLTEMRVKDLRFTPDEAAQFLNHVMGLNLSAENIRALETRTEGWVVGLQLAAISMQGYQDDSSSFIKSFTGNHRFVLDYLVEEVIQQQPENIQTFLLYTSILDRMCASLCDAVLHASDISGQATLAYLEQANMFIIPLDNERRWYRYHHLFGDLLRQRLQQHSITLSRDDVTELHRRASRWYEENGLELEAFHHAVAAHDIENAARLVEGKGMPLFFRGGIIPVLNWLASLHIEVLNAKPALWVMYASVLLFANQLAPVEEKLQAAEVALQNLQPDDKTSDLIGHIATIRATLAVSQHDVESILSQAQRALAHLHPDNLPIRTATTWTLGYAYHLQGDRVSARRAYSEAVANSEAIGHIIISIMAGIGLGNVQEADNQLHLAQQTYQHILDLVGDSPFLVVCEAHLGLARIYYQWNDLTLALEHSLQSANLARQLEHTDRFAASNTFLARLKLAQGDVAGASASLALADQFVRQHNFQHQMSEIVAVQVLILLQQGNLNAAAQLAQKHDLPLSQARVLLAEGDSARALTLLAAFRQEVEAKAWADEQLKVMLLQALAYDMDGQKATALHVLSEALALAAPHDFIRIFLDEGALMAQLLSEVSAGSIMADYHAKLLVGFEAENQKGAVNQALIEALSQRELVILRLIAQGYSNQEISEQLFLALSTVKGHNQNIFAKLQVQRRTEAVARARELGLL